MSRANPRLLAWSLLLLALGALLALAIENVVVRYAGSVTAFAIGLSLLRRAVRLD